MWVENENRFPEIMWLKTLKRVFTKGVTSLNWKWTSITSPLGARDKNKKLKNAEEVSCVNKTSNRKKRKILAETKFVGKRKRNSATIILTMCLWETRTRPEWDPTRSKWSSWPRPRSWGGRPEGTALTQTWTQQQELQVRCVFYDWATFQGPSRTLLHI